MNNLVYLFLFLILFLTSLDSINYKNIRISINNYQMYIVLIFSIIVIICFRGFVHTDWIAYYEQYSIMPDKLTDLFNNRQSLALQSDIGYQILQVLCKKITNNYFFLQSLCSLIDILILLEVLKDFECKNIPLFFLFFIMFKGFDIEFNLLRNTKSLFLFLFSLRYIYKEKCFFKYVIINLVGALFHITALLFIPLYFFIDKKYSKKFYFFVFFITTCLFVLRIKFSMQLITFVAKFIPNGQLLLKVMYYINSENYSMPSVFSPIYLERIFSFVLLLYLFPKLMNDKKNVIMFNLFVLYYLFSVGFWDMYIIVQRVSLLFICSNWFLFIECFYTIKKKDLKCLIMFIILFYGGYKLYRDCTNPRMEYNFFFLEEDYSSKKNRVLKI